jgi:hypothetical protein
MAALEAFVRGMRMSKNPPGLSAVKLCPQIILYTVSCITDGLPDQIPIIPFKLALDMQCQQVHIVAQCVVIK